VSDGPDGEIAAALDENEQAPYGRVRTARAERLAELAEESGDRPLLIRALQDLTAAYSLGGEAPRIPVPFARVLAMWDAHPGDFTSWSRHYLHWQFKWITAPLLEHPEVPLAQISGWLEEMRSRYRAAGLSSRPVDHARESVADHLGDLDAARRAFDDWQAAPRDRGADCRACEGRYAGHRWWAEGDDGRAVAAWQPLLDGELSCASEPQGGRARALGALVRLGRLDRARAIHLADYRTVRGEVVHREAVERHLFFAARTGNEARALEILADHAAWLDPQGESPLDRAIWLARVIRLLRRLEELGHAALPVPTPRSWPGPVTAAGLRPRLEGEVTALAARFDVRNGTASVSTRLTRIMTAPPLVEHLPLGLRVAGLPVVAAGFEPAALPDAAGAVPDPAGAAAGRGRRGRRRPAGTVAETPAELLARAEALWQADGTEAEAVTVAFRAAHAADGRDDALAARARMLAAHACAWLGRHGEALGVLDQVVGDLDRSGTPEQRVAARRLQGSCLRAEGEHAEAARVLLEAARLAEPWPDPREQAGLAHSAADALLAAGRRGDAVRAYGRAAQLWQAAGVEDGAVRAVRARAWALADPDADDAPPDWDAATGLMQGALDRLTGLAGGRGGPDWVPGALVETRYQLAALLLRRCHHDPDAPDGLAGRALVLADEAATAFEAVPDPGRALEAALLAAELQLLPPRAVEAGTARVRAVATAAAGLGRADLEERCAELLSWVTDG